MAEVHHIEQPVICRANADYWRTEWENASEDYQHWLGRTIDNEQAGGMLAQNADRRDAALRNWLQAQQCKAAGIWA